MSRDLRDRIEALLEDDDRRQAHSAMGELWRQTPDSATAAFLNARLGKVAAAVSTARARVAVLRSFTVEPVVPLLRAAAGVAGIDLEVHLGEFNAYAQEILDPSSRLYELQPDLVFLAVQARDIAPDLVDNVADLSPTAARAEVERVLDSYRTWVGLLRERTEAHVVLHNLEEPAMPPSGLLAAQRTSWISRVNSGLRTLAGETQGVYVLDYDALVARHGRLGWHDPAKWLTVRLPIRAEHLLHLAEEWRRCVHPLTGRICKALVCDLDNTLWGGVIGEDGPDGIALGVEYPGAAFRDLQRAILDLTRRGVILAICSKNNLEDAMPVLEEHPQMLLRPDDFAAWRIDWTDKAHNLRQIAADLNIGTDALAFLDDNPVERQLVRTQLPEVTVIDLPDDPMGYAAALRSCPVFERLSLAGEDRKKSRMYVEQRKRRELQDSTGSLEEFYASLEMQADFSLVEPATLPRAAQLTQKTNQFNMTTRRYNEQQIAAFSESPDKDVYTVGVRDRFGDNGTVGLMIVDRAPEAWEIDTFLMSCRVIGRTVETAMLATLAERAREAGVQRLSGSFLPTKKNAPAKEVYARHGFRCVSENDGQQRWEFDLDAAELSAPPWIERTFRWDGTNR